MYYMHIIMQRILHAYYYINSVTQIKLSTPLIATFSRGFLMKKKFAKWKQTCAPMQWSV